MKIKSILKYEKYFWAVVMLVVSSFTLYYGYQEKAGIDKLKIYGCPYNKFICEESEKVFVGLEVDNEYNFRNNPDGSVYDPYGHYARKKKIATYILISILLLGSLAIFKVYWFIKHTPNIYKYFKDRMKEERK